MALILKQPGTQPLGQFDGLDTTFLSLKGGEVVVFKSTSTTSTDKAAADDFDGYVLNAQSGAVRPVVDVVTAGFDGYRPFMLADEGIVGYGTLFGTVVGGIAGQTVYGPNSTVASADKLGPSTATGSGKVTCWDKPGLYAVTLDACDNDAAGGLAPSNQALYPGAPLFVRTGGLLTPTQSRAISTSATPIVGRFVEFEDNGSLVTTPNRLVAAVNSPSGNVTSVVARPFTVAVFWFDPSGSLSKA